jgi:hypothetical protein
VRAVNPAEVGGEMPDTLAELMAEYETPSAGKFGPPPGAERFEAPTPRTTRAWYTIPLAIAYFLVRYQFRLGHARGWSGALLALAAAATGIADYFVWRRARDRRDREGPYSPPPNITR